jgi:hypothetical protein
VSEASDEDVVDAVIRALAQDEVGAEAGRCDVLDEVGLVGGLPDVGRDGVGRVVVPTAAA